MLKRAPTSTQLISASTQLSASTSTLLEPKYQISKISNIQSTKFGNFPKFWLKISKLSEYRTWYLGGADPVPDLDFWNSDPKIRFWANLGQKIQSCALRLKIITHGILEVLIPNLVLLFWNSDTKIHFWGDLGKKT